jgi:hypothetical protein
MICYIAKSPQLFPSTCCGIAGNSKVLSIALALRSDVHMRSMPRRMKLISTTRTLLAYIPSKASTVTWWGKMRNKRYPMTVMIKHWHQTIDVAWSYGSMLASMR